MERVSVCGGGGQWPLSAAKAIRDKRSTTSISETPNNTNAAGCMVMSSSVEPIRIRSR